MRYIIGLLGLIVVVGVVMVIFGIDIGMVGGWVLVFAILSLCMFFVAFFFQVFLGLHK